jgi:hypothetical protein
MTAFSREIITKCLSLPPPIGARWSCANVRALAEDHP